MNSTILHRSATSETFLEAVRSDPKAALAEYDVSNDVVEAVQSGDEAAIRDALDATLQSGIPNQKPPERT